MVPLFTGDIAFRQDVGKVVFGINILDLDVGVHVDSVKKLIKRDFVGTGHMFRCETSAFGNNLD